MNENNTIPTNPIVTWAKNRPLWERYIWKSCLEIGGLNPEQLESAYKYLLVETGVDNTDEILPEISLDGLTPPESDLLLPIFLKSLSGLKNVNAISEDQEIIFHEKLTLIYGGNGTGKSGYGRLLSKACFSRNSKNILPNLTKVGNQGLAEAIFTLQDDSKISYLDNGNSIETLKRFSVFDEDCVPIYIDGSNSLDFTPGQLQVFDRVNNYIYDIENRFNKNRNENKLINPIPLIFQSEQSSSVSSFLLSLSHTNTLNEIDDAIRFTKAEELRIQELETERVELIKLDPSRKKKELKESCNTLKKYTIDFNEYLDNFSNSRILGLNELVEDVKEKGNLVAQLGSAQFDTGALKAVGSEKWKALIIAAKELYEVEKNAGSNFEKCLLCNQNLNEKEQTLFEAYWKFLAGTAEADLKISNTKLEREIKLLESLTTKLPAVTDDNTAIKILNIEDLSIVEYLKNEIINISSFAEKWISSLKNLNEINSNGRTKIDWVKIDHIITSKTEEMNSLVDPSDRVKDIDTEILKLKHKQKASASSEEIIKYFNYLIWENKVKKVSFPKNKYTTARRDFFNDILSEKYKQFFNEEVIALDGHLGLNISTSGKEGDTVIKLGLEHVKINKLSCVLSEGEQKVSALADFLTEVRIDRNNCGIIFDDPVTSLDHERKEKIARRLVEESKVRQVIIFTHDIVFLNKIVKNAIQGEIDFFSHWIKKSEDGLFGIVEVNSNPRLSNLSTLKRESQDAMTDFRNMTSKQKESAISLASNHLRSGCEALIREKLFLNSMERYDDKVSIQILEEMPLDRDLIIKVIELHGRLSEVGSMHDRSDEMRESPIDRGPFDLVFQEFCILEKKFAEARESAKNERKHRQSGLIKSSQSWSGKV